MSSLRPFAYPSSIFLLRLSRVDSLYQQRRLSRCVSMTLFSKKNNIWGLCLELLVIVVVRSFLVMCLDRVSHSIGVFGVQSSWFRAMSSLQYQRNIENRQTYICPNFHVVFKPIKKEWEMPPLLFENFQIHFRFLWNVSTTEHLSK